MGPQQVAPRKIVLVGPGDPQRLRREAAVVEKITGIPVDYGGAVECDPEELVVRHPGVPVPSGKCRIITLPHLGLARALALAAAAYGWGRVLEWGEDKLIAEVTRLVLEDLWSDEPILSGERAWMSVGGPAGLRVPLRPPPLVLAADVYATGDPGRSIAKAHRLASSGADIIVVGGYPGGDSDSYRRVLRVLSRDYTVFSDPAGLIGPEEAYSLGAVGYMSVTQSDLAVIDEAVRKEMVFVVVPSKLSGDPVERIADLAEAARRARELGYEKLILDPVLQPLVYPGALAGLVAARLASGHGHPVMLGINNVYELLDADTTGSIPVLVGLAAEAGASILLVSEESDKARGAVIEARTAADLVSLSLALETPPKDYPLRLLVAKEKRLW